MGEKKRLPKKYANEENVCPVCGSSDIDEDGEEFEQNFGPEMWTVEVTTNCFDCGARWEKVYYCQRIDTYRCNTNVRMVDEDDNETEIYEEDY